MNANEPVLLRRDEDGIAWLTLNRPAQRNALSSAMLTALQGEIDALARDRKTKVVVIAGSGPGFCAGHDLREMRANPGRQAYEAVFAHSSRLMIALTKLPQPVIARVHGIAAAAGCQLVASCDLVVASSAARFAVNGVNLGLFCSTPMVALTRAVGRKAAMEMLMTGDLVEAEHAKAIGLVNRVVPPDQLDAEVDGAGTPDRGQAHACRDHRQGGVLPPGRAWTRGRLRLHHGGHGEEHGGARHRGRGRCLPREAPAELAAGLNRAWTTTPIATIICAAS